MNYRFKKGVNLTLVPYGPEHAQHLYEWYYDHRYEAYFREFDDVQLTLEDCKHVGENLKRVGVHYFAIQKNDSETGGTGDGAKPNYYDKAQAQNPGKSVENANKQNEIIGLMSYQVMKKKAGVHRFGILLDASTQHKSYAIEAIILLAFYLFEFQGCRKLMIEYLERDHHIRRISEQGGFEFEAILKEEACINGEYLNEAKYFITKEKAFELYGSFYNSLSFADS